MILVTSAEHALAAAAKDAVSAAKFVEQKVLPVLVKANSDAATIESVTSLVSPDAANIERAAFAVLGVVLKAIQDAGTAAGSSGLSISLDQTVVADVKAIAPAVTALVSSSSKK